MRPFHDHTHDHDTEAQGPGAPSAVDRYLVRLAVELHARHLDPVRVGLVLAETHAHVLDSGEDPSESFGDPTAYAEEIAASLPSYDATDWEYRTFSATAADEREILAQAGRQGWELVGCGALALHCRRPRLPAATATSFPGLHQWEYRRRVSVRPVEAAGALAPQGWQLAASWLPFLYFKRPVRTPVEPDHVIEGHDSDFLPLMWVVLGGAIVVGVLTTVGEVLAEDMAWLRWTVIGLQLGYIALVAGLTARYVKRHNDRTGES